VFEDDEIIFFLAFYFAYKYTETEEEEEKKTHRKNISQLEF
jgi:hypothetical protein